jgi:hypothetical protein
LAAIAEYDLTVPFSESIGDFDKIFGTIDNSGKSSYYNFGAYTSSAGCSFIVFILYIIQSGFVIKSMCCKGYKNNHFLL